MTSDEEGDLDGWVDHELASELVGTMSGPFARTPCIMHLPDGTEVQLVEGQNVKEEEEDWEAARMS